MVKGAKTPLPAPVLRCSDLRPAPRQNKGGSIVTAAPIRPGPTRSRPPPSRAACGSLDALRCQWDPGRTDMRVRSTLLSSRIARLDTLHAVELVFRLVGFCDGDVTAIRGWPAGGDV